MAEQKIKGQRFTTPVGRLSFPKLIEPEAYKGKGKKSYSTQILFTKDTDLKAIQKLCKLAVAEKYGKKVAKWPSVVWPWKDGDDQEKYESMHGCWVWSAKTSEDYPPSIFDVQRNDITKSVSDKDAYGGRYARLGVVAKCVEGPGGENYCSLYLQAVQLVELSESKAALLNLEPGKGDPFGGSSKDMFDDEFSGDIDDDLTEEDEDIDNDIEDDEDDDLDNL